MGFIQIMIADGDHTNLNAIDRYFSQKDDIKITYETANGCDLLRRMGKEPPDLVIMSLVLSGMDGFSLLEEMARYRSRAPRSLIMTAIQADWCIERAIQLGADYFMYKPVSPELLYRRVIEISNMPRKAVAYNFDADSEADLREWLGEILIEQGIPANMRGFTYLIDAIELVRANPDVLSALGKALYPAIAERNHTKAASVERSIRTVAEHVWRNQWGEEGPSAMNGRLTNAAFLRKIIDLTSRRPA